MKSIHKISPKFLKGLCIKDVRSHGEGDVCPLSSVDKGERSSSDADIRTFWCKKLRISLNLWRVRTDRGRGVNFWRFCADVFYGRPLTNVQELILSYFDNKVEHKQD